MNHTLLLKLSLACVLMGLGFLSGCRTAGDSRSTARAPGWRQQAESSPETATEAQEEGQFPAPSIRRVGEAMEQEQTSGDRVQPAGGSRWARWWNPLRKPDRIPLPRTDLPDVEGTAEHGFEPETELDDF